MGYLISAYITHDKPDTDWLEKLPDSIGYNVYHHRKADVYMIDNYVSANSDQEPFQNPFPMDHISMEFPAQLKDFEEVYNKLYSLKLIEKSIKSQIIFTLYLNRLLGIPVLSFISDDDELDFACTVSGGLLTRAKYQIDDLIITYQNGKTLIQPFLPEGEQDEELLSDIQKLRKELPEVIIADRTNLNDSQLHKIALEGWRLFSQQNEPIIGLGSFEPSEDIANWKLIASSAPVEAYTAVPLEPECFVEGELLVVKSGAILPPICIKTNQALTQKKLVKKDLSSFHPVLGLLIFLNPIIFLIIYYLVRKKCTVEFGLHPDIKKRNSRNRYLLLAVVIASLISLPFLSVLKTNIPLVFAFLIFISSFIAIIFVGIPLKITTHENGYFWLSGCSKEYLENLDTHSVGNRNAE